MTPLQREVFSYLLSRGPSHVAEIARRLYRGDRIINAAVRSLEKKGLAVSVKRRSRRVCMVAGKCWL